MQLPDLSLSAVSGYFALLDSIIIGNIVHLFGVQMCCLYICEDIVQVQLEFV